MAFLEEIVKKWPYGIYIAVLVSIVWQGARFYHKFIDMKKKTDNIGKKIDDKIEPTLIKINSTLDKLTMYLITKNSLEAGYFTSRSPIELNEAAKEILEKSGGKTLMSQSHC